MKAKMTSENDLERFKEREAIVLVGDKQKTE